MEEELISKKELLEQTGISYGQLYRWKRKGLIPDEWFIRKSTYTGQETFFPRSRMLSRVGKIKNMKEDISLDDLADVFSPSADEISMAPDELIRRGIVSGDVIKLFLEDRSDAALDFGDILYAHLFSLVLTAGEVSLDEARLMLDVLRTSEIRFSGKPAAVCLTRKLGVYGCFALSAPGDVCLDKDMRLIRRFDLPAAAEELKLKLV